MRIHPLLLGLLLAACTDDPADPNPGGSGELGVGIFTYYCRGEGDHVCSIGQTSAGFPKDFALGGRFGVTYAWMSATDHINEPLPALQTAAPEQLSLSADTFTARASGYAAILAVTGNSEVVDLIHAPIRAIDELRLVDGALLPNLAPLTAVALPLSGTAEIQLVPFDQNDVPLAGALEVAWTLDSDVAVHIAAGQGTGRVRVEALAAGEATLTATHGDKLVTIPITVDPLLDPTTGPTDTGDPDTVGTTTLTTGGTDTDDTDATGPGTSSTGDTDTTATSTTDTSGTTTDTTGGVL